MNPWEIVEVSKTPKTSLLQFLEENPSAALDASLMSSLNAMTTNIVQQSFRYEKNSIILENDVLVRLAQLDSAKDGLTDCN